jgi:hypothetical protein
VRSHNLRDVQHPRDILLGHWGESIIASLSGMVARGHFIFVYDAY